MKRRILNLMNNQSLCTMARRCFAGHQKLLLVALFAFCGIMGAKADYTKAVTWNGYYFKLDLDKLTAQVVYNDENKLFTAVDIPYSIVFNGKTYTIKAIAPLAFINCRNIKSVTIPAACTDFYDSSFKGCTGVTTLVCVAPTNNYFTQMKNLEEAHIWIAGDSIPSNYFESNKKIREAHFYGDYTSIGQWAFWSCETLQKVHFYSKSLQRIGEGAFQNCSSLEECYTEKSLKTIETFAFDHCVKLTIFPLYPTSVETIGHNAFWSCSSFKGASFPKTLTKIGNYAFAASGITDPGLHNTVVTEIGAGAFNDCHKLKTQSYPSTLKTIGAQAFSGCELIQTALLGGTGVTSIGYRAYEDCTKLRVISLPPSLTTLGTYAFAQSGLIRIDGLDKTRLTIIPSNSFYHCTGLVSLDLPYCVGRIDESAFEGCTGLARVSFGKNMKFIEESAFSGCHSLKTITTTSTSAIEIKQNAFLSSELDKSMRNPILIDYALYEDYKNYGWENYFSFTFPKATQIKIDKSSATINVGETTTLTATLLPAGTPPSVTWHTDNSKVATVANGIVYGVSEGFTTITATTTNGLKATCKVWVGQFGRFDVNKDGSVNSADVVAVYNDIIYGGATTTTASDVNDDGSVNSADAVAIYNYILRDE